MTLTLPKFYGGYEKFQWTGNKYLGTLSKRFLRVGSIQHEGSLFLPPANVLPIIRGGAIFTIWNVGSHNILLKDNQGGSVGCIQGTSREPATPACWTNVFLLDSSTAAGGWHINCVTCSDPTNSDTDDTTFTDDCVPGVDCVDTTTTTETDDDGTVHVHQQI